jgi:hypothetical protein
MFKLLEYFGRFQAMRGRLIQLPAWARVLLFIAALPGIVLISLSIAALGVSILALLLLTVPLYRLLKAVCGPGRPVAEEFDAPANEPVETVTVTDAAEAVVEDMPAGRARRQIDVKIID